MEAALAAAWSGAGPAPTRPVPPSLFVASESRGAGRVSPSKRDVERPFGFVRDELARFASDSQGSGRARGGGDKALKESLPPRQQKHRLQLCNSSSSSSSGHLSADSEDSLQADASSSVIHRGCASSTGSRSSDAARVADALALDLDGDSEVCAQPPPSDVICSRRREATVRSPYDPLGRANRLCA